MITEVSADQVNRYRGDGFLVVEDFLDSDELAVWRAAFDRAVAARQSQLEDRTRQARDAMTEEQRAAADAYSRVFLQLQQLWRTDDAMRELLLDERIGRVCASLAGVDGLRVWHDQALIKPRFGSPTDFHMDVPFWSFTSTDAITIWLALDDATLENGCLWYVPASHRAEQTTFVKIMDGIGAIFEENDAWGVPEPVPALVRAGGAVFHNGLIVHGAGANMTPRPRRAMTCAFMPDGARYNGRTHGILGRAYAESLQVGDVLDNDERLPLVWSARARA